jgi:hypothetical protein
LYNILQLYHQEGSGGGNVAAGVEGRDQAAIKQDSSEVRAGVDPLKTSPARKWRARGRIEHTLLDGAEHRYGATPTDLRPSPATPPYHKKLQMFLFATKGRSPVGELRPMIEAGAPSTEEVARHLCGVVPAPLGVVMLAPPEVPRNASRAQTEGRDPALDPGPLATYAAIGR